MDTRTSVPPAHSVPSRFGLCSSGGKCGSEPAVCSGSWAPEATPRAHRATHHATGVSAAGCTVPARFAAVPFPRRSHLPCFFGPPEADQHSKSEASEPVASYPPPNPCTTPKVFHKAVVAVIISCVRPGLPQALASLCLPCRMNVCTQSLPYSPQAVHPFLWNHGDISKRTPGIIDKE